MTKRNGYIVFCKKCGKQFRTVPSLAKIFCSPLCRTNASRGKTISEEHRKRISEANKRNPPSTAFKKGQHVSPKTQFKKGQLGNKAGHWKGGITKDSRGYFMILKHGHPRASKKGYVKKSILVMEQKIGRYLYPKEVVHHIDRNIGNDRPDNLQLFNNNSEHIKFHYSQGFHKSKV